MRRGMECIDVLVGYGYLIKDNKKPTRQLYMLAATNFLNCSCSQNSYLSYHF